MTISPSNPPWTDDTVERNMKPRRLYCPICKYTIISKIPAAHCGDCNASLVTVLNTSGNLD
jgi:hypothetical protein